MRILITGMTGFVGGHLTELLLGEGGHTLVGYGRSAQWPAGLAHLQDRTTLCEGELLDVNRLESVIRHHEPEWIFHLAGYANPGDSKKEPEVCRSTNIDGTRFVYEAVTRLKIQSRIVFASTGSVYGRLESHQNVIDESSPFAPDTPYSESKLAAERLTKDPRYQHLQVIPVRMFNQIGPRQLGNYFTPTVANEIVAIERGLRTELNSRDISAYRDFTDVRDMVKALRAIMEKGTPGKVYNACSGNVRSLYDVLLNMIRLSRTKIAIPAKPENYGQPSYTTSSNRLKELGWQPSIPFEQTLNDILNFWRGR